jgi:hypothetical protein
VARGRYEGTVRVFPGPYLGSEEEPRPDAVLFEGLAAIANLKDDVRSYRKLQLKHPYMWPMRVTDEEGQEKLTWTPEGFALLRLYRDLLRKVWIWPCDPEDLGELKEKRESLEILFGTAEFLKRLPINHSIFPDSPQGRYEQIWQDIRRRVPGATPDSTAHVYPSWPSGQFVYIAQNQFQEGLYLLFRESWRAGICIGCRSHFIADKHQRRYCSPKCAAAAKKLHDLEWWHREHGRGSKTKNKRGEQ